MMSIQNLQAKPIQRPDLIAARKARLRTEAAALRKKAWLKSGASASKAIAETGVALIQALGVAPKVSGYHPIRQELDPMLLLIELHKSGARIALPRMDGHATLTFREWLPGETLDRGKLGIYEPGTSQPELRPAVVLAPLLAFDRFGNRLGYGGGYYDRSLRLLRGSGAVIAIGIAFEEQEFPEIPAEPQDERLDMVLTPSRIVACGEV
jgi:5-formyltetrahydrofolate cyclo-ligase